MRIYEFRLPAIAYGRNALPLCYGRAKNRRILYDDSTQPRIEIAQVFWGDKGWTYEGAVNASILDTFASAQLAMIRAFYQYANQKLHNHDL